MDIQRVAIIGGGIGGLTTAIALQRHGFETHIYEAAEELNAVGAGIMVPPNALQVLDRLGLAEAVRAEGTPSRLAEVYDYRAGLLQVIDLAAVERRWDWPTVAIHRARLQRVLVSGVAPGSLYLGKACRRVVADGRQAGVEFADGSETHADIVVGADGIRSVTRHAVQPDVQLRYSGQTSYRAVVPFELPPELVGVAREIWGPGRRFGFTAIGHGEVYWYATLDAAEGERDVPGAVGRRLATLFTTFPAPIGDLIAATPDDRILRTDMYDFRPIPSWHQGRIVLLGDAAHATTPNLGQGGAQAIEDAWVLADRLSAGPNPETAIREYERIRMPKARMVVKRSWTLGRVAHLSNPLARQLRNTLLRHTPASVLRRQTEALYELGY